MDNETREKIALVRYKLISPVLAEPSRAQNHYFRTHVNRFRRMLSLTPPRSYKLIVRLLPNGL